MKNYQLLELGDKLNKNLANLKELRGAKFAYTIVKNINLLNEEIKTIQTIGEPSDRYKKYEEERIKICQDLCEKDADGNLVSRNLGNGLFEYAIDTNSAEWKDAIGKLQLEYEADLSDYTKQVTDYNEFLLKDSTINLFKMSFEDVPTDISLDMMGIIEPFIS